jgi:hypothetical protein
MDAHGQLLRLFFEANPGFSEKVARATKAYLEHNEDTCSYNGLTAYFVPMVTLIETDKLLKHKKAVKKAGKKAFKKSTTTEHVSTNTDTIRRSFSPAITPPPAAYHRTPTPEAEESPERPPTTPESEDEPLLPLKRLCAAAAEEKNREVAAYENRVRAEMAEDILVV